MKFLIRFYDLGEGWVSGKIFQTQSVDYTITGVTNRAPAWGLPELEVMLVGRGSMAHQVEIYVGTSYRLLTSLNFTGYEPQKIVLPIQWSDIAGDDKLTVRVKVNGVGGQPDRISMAYIKLSILSLWMQEVQVIRFLSCRQIQTTNHLYK